MVGFKAKVRGGGGGLLQPPRGGVGFGDRGPRLGGGHAPAGAVKGVPAEPQRLAGERENDHAGEDERRPRNRPGEAEEMARAHGKAFRSSSKCGPSRRRGQSPPQTMGVPCRAAADLKAAAMRG